MKNISPKKLRKTNDPLGECLRCGYSIKASRHFPLPNEDSQDETIQCHEFIGQDDAVVVDVRAELHRELDVILDALCIVDPHFVLEPTAMSDPVIRKKRLAAVIGIGAAYRAIVSRGIMKYEAKGGAHGR